MTPEDPARSLRADLSGLPNPLRLGPVARPFDVRVRPPGSKSITNRALLLAALARGESMLRGALLDADDARVMIDALRSLGADVAIPDDAGGALRVRGVDGNLTGGRNLDFHNAGTATRFLAAAACLADGPVTIDGNARMRERPIGELLSLLRSLGVKIDELGSPGCVPVRIHPARPRGGALEIGKTLSSQYLSALLLIGPWLERGIELRFSEPPTSPSYIEMTTLLLRNVGACGSSIDRDDSGVLRAARIDPGALSGFDLDIEPDASGATYFWAAASVVKGSRARVEGIGDRSLQGDARFASVLARMGAVTEESVRDSLVCAPDGDLIGIDADLSSMPDAAMTLAAVACFARGTTTIRGLGTLRIKETDRIDALRNELAKIGATIEVFGESGGEGIRITPPAENVRASPSAVEFDTYDDHRMAMSLAIIGLRRPNTAIRDPACVAKTYPTFWRDWSLLYEDPGAGNRR